MVVDQVRTVEPSGPWEEQIKLLAHSFRQFAQTHPRLMEYAFTSPDFIQRDGLLWTQLCRILSDAGLAPDDVEPVGAVLASLVGGLLLAQVNGALGRFVGADGADATAAAEGSFDVAVDILVAGLRTRLP